MKKIAIKSESKEVDTSTNSFLVSKNLVNVPAAILSLLGFSHTKKK